MNIPDKDWKFILRVLSEKLESWDKVLDMAYSNEDYLDKEDIAEKRRIIRKKARLTKILSKLKETVNE